MKKWPEHPRIVMSGHVEQHIPLRANIRLHSKDTWGSAVLASVIVAMRSFCRALDLYHSTIKRMPTNIPPMGAAPGRSMCTL